MANARVGLKTRGRNSASRQSSHIMRQGDSYKNANIIPLFIPKENAFLAPKLSLNATERKALGNKMQSYKSRQKKYEYGSPLWLKQEAKIVAIRQKLDGAGNQRKNTVNFFELELCLTNTPPTHPISKDYERLLREWLKKEFPELTPITGAVHLDQASLHAHIMFAVPEGMSWKQFVETKYGDNRIAPVAMTQSWHDHIGKHIELEALNTGMQKRFQKLKAYKAETGFTGSIGNANELPPQSHTETKTEKETNTESKKETAAQDQIKEIASTKKSFDRDALKRAVDSLKNKSTGVDLK